MHVGLCLDEGTDKIALGPGECLLGTLDVEGADIPVPVHGEFTSNVVEDYVHGVEAGKACPTCFHHPTRNIAVVVHGDDFTALGPRTDLAWYEAGVKKHFEVGDLQRLGADKDCKKEV